MYEQMRTRGFFYKIRSFFFKHIQTFLVYTFRVGVLQLVRKCCTLEKMSKIVNDSIKGIVYWLMFAP